MNHGTINSQELKDEGDWLKSEAAAIKEQEWLAAEKKALNQLEVGNDGTTPPSKIKTKEIPLYKAGVSPGDIRQAQNVNQKELSQLQGESLPVESVGDIIPQMASDLLNPVRKLFGAEPRQPGTYIDPITQWQADETTRRISLAKRGIGSGDSSLGSRFIESLAMDDQNRVKAIQKNLNDTFDGKDVELWVDKETGDLLYQNPDNRKVYTANPIGFEFGDIVSYTGDAIVGIAETLGTVYGAGKALAKKAFTEKSGKEITDNKLSNIRARREVGYGAAGAAVGEALKISLGKVFGINDEVTAGEIAIEALKEGSLSLGIGTGLEATKALIKKVRSIRGNQVIPGDLLDYFKEKTDNITDKDFGSQVGGNKVVDAINDTLVKAQSASVLAPNVGQLLNDSKTLDMVESLSKGGTAEKAALQNRQIVNESALGDYFTIIGQEVTENAPIGKSQLANNIQGVSVQSLEQQKQSASAATQSVEQLSKKTIEEMPVTTPYNASEIVRGAIYEEEAFYKKTFKDEYDYIGELAKKHGVESYLTKMKLEIAALDTIETGAKSKDISKEFIDGDLGYESVWSLTKINNTLKRFNELKRESNTGKSKASTGKIKKVIALLNNAQQDILKDDPDVLLKLNALSDAYKVGQEIFNDGIVNSIVNSKKRLATSDIFKAVIKNSDTAENTASAIMGNRDAMLAMQEGVNDLYIQEVTDNGIINIGKHEKFVRKYIETKILTPFYTEAQIKNLDTAGAIARIYKVEKEKTDALLTKINSTFEGKISNLSGKSLFNKVWGEESQESIVQLKVLLKDRPDIWSDVQAEMLNSIKTTIFSGGSLSVSSLGTLLEKNKRTIKEGLGEGYFKNLTNLQEGLDVVRRKGDKFDLDTESGWAKGIQIYLGRLHPRGKMVTQADKLRSVYARKLLTEMVLDPEKLRKMSALKRTRADSETYKLIVTRLGFGVLANDDDGDFRSAMRDIGYKAGLVYRRQQQVNARSERKKEKQQQIEKAKQIKSLQDRQKSLRKYN